MRGSERRDPLDLILYRPLFANPTLHSTITRRSVTTYFLVVHRLLRQCNQVKSPLFSASYLFPWLLTMAVKVKEAHKVPGECCPRLPLRSGTVSLFLPLATSNTIVQIKESFESSF